MMRRYFASDVYAFIFCAANGFDRAFCRNVSDVDVRAGFLGENNIADDIDLFGQGGHSFEAEQ